MVRLQGLNDHGSRQPPCRLKAKGEDLSVSSKPSALVLFNPVLLLDGPLAKPSLNDDEALGRPIFPLLGFDSTLPPTLLLYGSENRLREPAAPFLARAKANGERAELYTAEGSATAFSTVPPGPRGPSNASMSSSVRSDTSRVYRRSKPLEAGNYRGFPGNNE